MTNFGNNNVELSGYYGGDESHALSAWTSSARELTFDKRNRMGKFLKFLAENGHHTPFEKSYLHFLITCDTASHIHFLKHRIGVSVNGESARYKELKDDKTYVPYDWPDNVKELFKERQVQSVNDYHWALEKLEAELGRKRAKESARYFLSYANQLTLDVAFNFRSFMHFLNLRYKEDAQHEIYQIAGKMLALVRNTSEFYMSLEAFGH